MSSEVSGEVYSSISRFFYIVFVILEFNLFAEQFSRSQESKEKFTSVSRRFILVTKAK